MEKAVLDRIVDDSSAVLLVGNRQDEVILPVHQLPENAREGTWLLVRIEEGKLEDVRIDTTETLDNKKRIQEKMVRLRRQSKKR
ncbi:DUF3006 domain-containing protein [Desertibacillus haloalkaliphilus]|uniref:DUF3006 domain-containing protein n=1 Tax=Desertibacillus haloalkaliphilus TaxID=1328930 RepID=UPI001C27F3EE|nr:DUF3006 domain-containing protein [Desertibacillus haloalkaliphilus]MBU8905001.1 DUF3006 domain-containing protein [Desertibacillus haloalkaliphilus]